MMNTISKFLKTWVDDAQTFIDAHPNEIGGTCLIVAMVAIVWGLITLVDND